MWLSFLFNIAGTFPDNNSVTNALQATIGLGWLFCKHIAQGCPHPKPPPDKMLPALLALFLVYIVDLSSNNS